MKPFFDNLVASEIRAFYKREPDRVTSTTVAASALGRRKRWERKWDGGSYAILPPPHYHHRANWHFCGFRSIPASHRYRFINRSFLKSVKMHIYDKVCERILEQNFSTEALNWITNQERGCRCIWEFTPAESQEIINEIYSRGAAKVEALGNQADIDDHGSIDMVLVYLPTDRASRAMLFDIERKLAEETGFDASIDEGQRFILIRWT